MNIESGFRANPYVGLRPFSSEDSLYFFGRDAQTLELLEVLHQTRFLAVVGSSGCGKSSLILAGLIPTLLAGFLVQERDRWRIATARPGGAPIRNLAEALCAALGQIGEPGAADEMERRIREGQVDGLLEHLSASLESNANLLVLIDQFEEIFAFRGDADRDGAAATDATTRKELAARKAEAADFVNLLLDLAARSGLSIYIVLTMRTDFLGDCDLFYGLPEAMNRGRYLVPRLTRQQLREAIEGPAKLMRAAVAPRLLDQLLNELGDRFDRLPVLQHALMRTWDVWQQDGGVGPIDRQHYAAAGGLDCALDRDAEAALKNLNQELVARVFKRLTDTDANHRRVRHPARLSELVEVSGGSRDDVDTIISRFREDGRDFLYVSADGTPDDPRVDISHESLIRQWNRLRGWVDEERVRRDAYVELADRGRRWAGGKAGLLRDPDLAVALAWAKDAKPTPAWAARYSAASDFDAVIRFLEESRSEAEAAARREQHHRRRTVMVSGTLAIIFAFLFLFSLFAERKANQQQLAAQSALREAVAGKVVMQSRGILDGEEADTLDMALLLAATGFRLNPNGEAYAGLQHALTMTPQLAKVLGLPESIIAFSNDGHTLITASQKNDIASVFGGDQQAVLHLWDTGIGRQRGAPIVGLKSLPRIAFSPDSRTFATGNSAEGFGNLSQNLRLWDVASGRALSAPLELGPTVQDPRAAGILRAGNPVIAFSPNGRLLASSRIDNSLRLLDVATGQEVVTPMLGHSKPVTSLVFSPDGKTLVSGSEDKTLRVWDLDSGQRRGAPLEGDAGEVTNIVYSRDSKRIASTSKDQILRLWDVGSGRLPLQGETSKVTSVVFSPDGKTFVSGGSDGTLRLWDTAGRQTGTIVQAHSGAVRSVSFTADQVLVSAGNDNTLRFWDRSTWQTSTEPSRGHMGGVTGVAFSPDSKTVVSSGSDGTVRLWDASTGQPRGTPFPGYPSKLTSVAFGHDGSTVTTLNGDGTLRSLDTLVAPLRPSGGAQNGGVPHVSLEHVSQLAQVAFSSDGSTVVLGACDRLRLLDAGTGLPRCEVSSPHGSNVCANSVAFSRDNKTVISAAFNGMRLWNSTTCKQVGPTMTGATGLEPFLSVAISPDGKTAAASGTDALFIWDTKSRVPVARGNIRGRVTSLAFSADGKMIVSGGEDGAIHLLDAISGQAIGVPIQGSKGSVTSVAFSPDGKRVVSGNSEGIVRMWNAPDAWIDRICAKLARNLSQAEWRKYVGNITYVKQCPELPVPVD